MNHSAANLLATKGIPNRLLNALLLKTSIMPSVHNPASSISSRRPSCRSFRRYCMRLSAHWCLQSLAHRASNCTILHNQLAFILSNPIQALFSPFLCLPAHHPTPLHSFPSHVSPPPLPKNKKTAAQTHRFVRCLYSTRWPQFLHRMGSPRLSGTS